MNKISPLAEFASNKVVLCAAGIVGATVWDLFSNNAQITTAMSQLPLVGPYIHQYAVGVVKAVDTVLTTGFQACVGAVAGGTLGMMMGAKNIKNAAICGAFVFAGIGSGLIHAAEMPRSETPSAYHLSVKPSSPMAQYPMRSKSISYNL
ncbi:MAG: hypothetical protein IPI58_03990 [Alphaproteobacteria bacterium]|nr:MAG: hypothetical protein IPI58_03990 [Alphaproteobacteria bacterium]